MKKHFFFIYFTIVLILSMADIHAQSQIVFDSSNLRSIVNDSYNQGKYSAEVKLTCEIMADPPNDCYTSIFFNDKHLPSLLYHGEVKAMAMADINMDGSICSEHIFPVWKKLNVD